jgi:hypothetical protein
MFLRNEPNSFSRKFCHIDFRYSDLRRLQSRLQMGSFSKTNPISGGKRRVKVRICAVGKDSARLPQTTAASRELGSVRLSLENEPIFWG